MNQLKNRQPRNSNGIHESIKRHSLSLPYQGEKRSTIMKTLSKELKKTFPDNIKMEVTYTGTK